MANKKVKKVDVKKVSKMQVSKELMEYFVGKGAKIDDGKKFGFTEGTLVLHMDNTDIQIKLITPKAGVTHYEELVEEEEVEVTEEKGE